MAKRTRRKSGPKTKRSRGKASAAQTKARRVERALRVAKRVYASGGFNNDYDPDTHAFFEHDDPGWEPADGWQGDALAEEISYMTHEEKIEWLEWLAEQLDTTVSELFEMLGSP